MNQLDDMHLLDAYARERSEDAFRELVVRHGDFIYSVALRQLGNPHLAEEAAQSAFIALAGKAGRLGPQTIIAGWLHRAVHFAGLKLLRAETRRKRWEEQATMELSGQDEYAFEEHALPYVDAALAELNESDRDAVVLRFLRQQSLHEVARALGTSEEAAKKRVSRALEKLRSLLARRGIAISVAALAVGLSQLEVNAAPGSLPSMVASLVVRAAVPATSTTGVVLERLSRTRAGIFIGSTGAAIMILLTAFVWQRRQTTPVQVTPQTVQATNTMQIKVTSVLVINQATALKFYTEVLGFVKKTEVPVGAEQWLTVVSAANRNGIELLLEPMSFRPARTYQAALHQAGIPLTSFVVGDVQHEYERLAALGVVFTRQPTAAGAATIAVFDDTCGNLIQLAQPSSAGNARRPSGIEIQFNSVFVEDQDKALQFYTGVLGFVKKHDLPAGPGRWLTVVSPEEPEGAELLLEPLGFEPARTFQEALRKAGIPATSFAVTNIEQAVERLKKRGVVFHGAPIQMGPVTVASFEDTCGNLIQMAQQ